MSATSIRFHSRFSYQGRPEDAPALEVTLASGSDEIGLKVFVDTGAERSLFKGEELEALGWSALPSGDPSRMSFQTATGATLSASPLATTVTLADGTAFDATVYVADCNQLRRNLLGRDILRRLILGLDDERQEIYITSLRDNARDAIISSE